MSVSAPPGGGGFASIVIAELRLRLNTIDSSLSRLVELMQAPRDNPLAAGSLAFGGTVGVTPGSSTVNPPAGMPPGVVLDANPHRRGLNIQNLSAAGGPNLTIGLGSTSPTAGNGLVLAPGQSWNGLISDATWLGTVSVVASGAGCAFSGLEVAGRTERRDRGGNVLNLPLG